MRLLQLVSLVVVGVLIAFNLFVTRRVLRRHSGLVVVGWLGCLWLVPVIGAGCAVMATADSAGPRSEADRGRGV